MLAYSLMMNQGCRIILICWFLMLRFGLCWWCSFICLSLHGIFCLSASFDLSFVSLCPYVTKGGLWLDMLNVMVILPLRYRSYYLRCWSLDSIAGFDLSSRYDILLIFFAIYCCYLLCLLSCSCKIHIDIIGCVLRGRFFMLYVLSQHWKMGRLLGLEFLL